MPFTTEHDLLQDVLSETRETAWKQFYVKYSPLVLSCASRRGVPREDLQDILQETMLELFIALPRFRYDPKRGMFRNFVIQITRRKCGRYFRRHQRMGTAIPIEASKSHLPAQERQSTPDGADALPSVEMVELALGSLRRSGRIRASSHDAYRAYALEGEPVESVAKRMQMTTGQIYRIKHRVNQQIASFLKSIDEEDCAALRELEPDPSSET